MNVADWSPSDYIWSGPGVNEHHTSVARTAGWHKFTLQVTTTGFDALIDQAVVGSVAGDFTFDTVRLFLSGPVWRPDATFYFDDFPFDGSIPGQPGTTDHEAPRATPAQRERKVRKV